MYFYADLSQASPAAPGTVVGLVTGPDTTLASSLVQDWSHFQALRIDAVLTGATGGTLDVYLQSSSDDGATWVDLWHSQSVVALAAAARSLITIVPTTGIVSTIGAGASPLLAANSVASTHWGSKLRTLFVAGAGTSAGAAQTIKVSGVAWKAQF